MRQIGSRLTSVVTALNDEAHGNFDTGVLGMDDAVGALSDFVSGWSHGRSEISSGVKDAQTSLNSAAGNYEKAEGQTTKAFSGGDQQ